VLSGKPLKHDKFSFVVQFRNKLHSFVGDEYLVLVVHRIVLLYEHPVCSSTSCIRSVLSRVGKVEVPVVLEALLNHHGVHAVKRPGEVRDRRELSVRVMGVERFDLRGVLLDL